MYPFERFTEAAKYTLTLAQSEAERSNHSYIGTERILLGLANQRGTVAGETLNLLGLGYEDVRDRIHARLGRSERMLTQQMIPTSRVKNVIEISFKEARRMGNNYVGTEHLLLGLLIEDEGIAALVLKEAGANIDRVRETIVVARQNGIEESASAQHTPYTPDLTAAHPSWARRVVAAASLEAAADAESEVSDAHVLRALLASGDKRVLRALRQLGIEREQLSALLRPPEEVINLRRSLRAAVTEKRAAATREDYEAAEVARRLEVKLRDDLKAAEVASEDASDQRE